MFISKVSLHAKYPEEQNDLGSKVSIRQKTAPIFFIFIKANSNEKQNSDRNSSKDSSNDLQAEL